MTSTIIKMENQNNNVNVAAFAINIHVLEKNDQPYLELRKLTCDKELIKAIISAAFHNRPIILQPTFTDRLRALGSLQEKGIIYLDPDTEEYKYTF